MGVWGAGLCENQPDPQCKKKEKKKETQHERWALNKDVWAETTGQNAVCRAGLLASRQCSFFAPDAT